jgi:transcriptional regulator with XRE-family HTH domain
MFSMETFGNWLLSQLRQRNMTQAELARLAGINRGTLSNIINGHKQIGRDVLISISGALRLPIDIVARAAEGKPPSFDEWSEKMNHKIGQLTGTRREMAERLLDTLLDEQERETREIKPAKT